MNSVLFGSGVDELDHDVIVQFSGGAQSRYLNSQHALRAALHIVNIDFELNYIENFYINFYYGYWQLNNMH